VSEDGAVIDPGHLLETAVRKGLLTEQTAGELSKDEVFSIIFQPGFSTAGSVTELSGRGVGMDVVKTNIARLGGVVDVSSEVGVGTTFTITLPITLAIISALIVRVRGQTFAIPLSTVQEALRLEPDGIRTVEGREVTVAVEVDGVIAYSRARVVPGGAGPPVPGYPVPGSGEGERVPVAAQPGDAHGRPGSSGS
jgi:two-component system, chemotaxis family, sensor kinase CheA